MDIDARVVRSLSRKSGEINLLLDDRFEIVWHSDTVAPILGWRDVVGRNAVEFVHPDDVSLVLETLARAVSAEDHDELPALAAEAGETVTFGDVLLVADGDAVSVGKPTLDGASVKAEVVGHGRDRKVIVFKRKRRKGYRRKQGHRQGFTEIRVEKISA